MHGRRDRIGHGVDAVELRALAVQLREPEIGPAGEARARKGAGEALAREAHPAGAARGLAVLEHEETRDRHLLRGELVQLRLRILAQEDSRLEARADRGGLVCRAREVVPPALIAEP